ncbi:acetoacetate--CoA ligase [Arboricoccus pini]|nr:acetoacetate--CoA ligase [Arboricoccus pini]
MSDQPLWRPDAVRAQGTQIMAFAQAHGFNGDSAITDLWHWSVHNASAFWQDIWRLGEVQSEAPYEEALVEGTHMRDARWFTGARLNFARNLLRRDDDTPALIFRGENGLRRQLSWAQLRAQVTALAAALKADGVDVGDRVAGYLPNLPETIIAHLATSSLGAIWSSCSPDFGVRGVLDRFGQIEPKVLITVDGYHYAGKRIDIGAKVKAVAAELPALVRIVMVPYLDREAMPPSLPGAVRWENYLSADPGPLSFAELPFDHPLVIMYSSGTTGTPKAIVHGQGGVLLNLIREHRLHSDIRPGERVFYFTTCGWMMWNWLVGALASQATLVLFDGSPFHRDASVLWRIAEEEEVSVFGTSAKYIDALRKADYAPRDRHALDRLRAVLSTGSPLVPEAFEWVYANVKRDLQLSSISGGTDILGCFALGNPAGPVFAGELQMRGLGMAVEVWNAEGRAVRGERGELVCTRPFPSMPVAFWNDPDGSRYHASYFANFPGIWCHGDYAELTQHDGIIILGRSDAVLNPGGVRIGTAEIYRQVEGIDEVQEAICVGQDWEGDVRVILFVKLKDGTALTSDLESKIKARIRENATPRHVPARILAVDDIPRTMSGKITEIAVRDVVHGRPVKNTEALANPDVLAFFKDRPELAH